MGQSISSIIAAGPVSIIETIDSHSNCFGTIVVIVIDSPINGDRDSPLLDDQFH